MEGIDIFFAFMMGGLFLCWVVTEFWYSKSNEATWIKKARGNKSVKKYRQSLVGRKLNGIENHGNLSEIEREQFNEVEQKQLQGAYSTEQQRIIWRLAWWIMIIVMLCVRIFSGEEV